MKKQKKWSRQDVVLWLQECSCKEEELSIHGTSINTFPYDPKVLADQVMKANNVDSATCPDTYQKVADSICSDPYSAIQAIRPLMQQIGVGCPQSFARALFDVFTAGQEMGIIDQFNVEPK